MKLELEFSGEQIDLPTIKREKVRAPFTAMRQDDGTFTVTITGHALKPGEYLLIEARSHADPAPGVTRVKCLECPLPLLD